ACRCSGYRWSDHLWPSRQRAAVERQRLDLRSARTFYTTTGRCGAELRPVRAIRPATVGALPGEGCRGLMDRATFFAIMGAFPTGVAIVTTMDNHNQPKGLTSNALCSVSAEPPLLLVCVDKNSNTLPALRHSQMSVVN